MNPTRSPLSDTALATALLELRSWSVSEGMLTREYRFERFIDAFGWMTSVALVAERLNHHPTWTNEYGHVKVQLKTHASNALTILDIELAREMDSLAAVRGVAR